VEEADPIRIEITDVFDLHPFAPRDVKSAVEAYLEEAHRLGLVHLRIIHGRGIGVQRESVHKILARTPYVVEFHDAPLEAGGWGATVVELAPVAPVSLTRA
jgi:dsDNA-specific endonuclease/ATPase MutS2